MNEVSKRRARQFVIVLLLRAHGKLQTQQLAEMLSVSARTIARDSAELELLGVPVHAERGATGGLRLLYQVPVDPVRFIASAPRRAGKEPAGPSLPSMDAAAAAAVEHLRLGMRDLLERLDGRNRADVQTALADLETSGLPAGAHVDAQVLLALRRALWQGRRVRLVYPTEGELHSRDVDPLVLVAHEGVWYLAGYCHWRRNVRTFVVSRIASAQPLEEAASIVQQAQLAGDNPGK